MHAPCPEQRYPQARRCSPGAYRPPCSPIACRALQQADRGVAVGDTGAFADDRRAELGMYEERDQVVGMRREWTEEGEVQMQGP